MARTLREIRDDVVSFGSSFDASLLDGRSARVAVERAARIVKAVRVDFDTLLRGYPVGGEVCEIAAFRPIAVLRCMS